MYGDGTFQTDIYVVLGGYTITTNLGPISEMGTSYQHFMEEHFKRMDNPAYRDEKITVKLSRAIPAGKTVGVFTTSTNREGLLMDWMLSRWENARAQNTETPALSSSTKKSEEKAVPSGTPRIVRDGEKKGWPVYRIENPVWAPGTAHTLSVGTIYTDGSGYGNVQPKRDEEREYITNVLDAIGGKGLIFEIDPAWENASLSVKMLEGKLSVFQVWGITEDGEVLVLKSGTRGSYGLSEILPSNGKTIKYLVPVINLTFGSKRLGGASFNPVQSKAEFIFVLR